MHSIEYCFATIRGNNLEQLKKELEIYNLSVNSFGVKDWSLMHCACSFGNSEIVKYLLSEGASLNIDDVYGELPIDTATYWGNFKVFKYLVENYYTF